MPHARSLCRPEVALCALTLGVYAYFYQAGGWNQNSRLDLTRAIVEHGTVSIDRLHANTGDKALRAGHYFSDKAPGVSFLALPAYAALYACDGQRKRTDEFQAWALHLSTLCAVGVPSALGAVALYRLVLLLGLPTWVGVGLPLAYALGTPALPYATLLYGHQTAAALLIVAFAIAVHLRRARQRDDQVDVGLWPLLLGLAWGTAIAVEYPAALAVGIQMLYACVHVRPARTLARASLGLALPLVGLATYHTVVAGSPFLLPYSYSTQEHRHLGVFMGLGRPDLQVLAAILWGQYRGLLPTAPWLALALPGCVALLRRYRSEGAVCMGTVLAFVWLNASLNDWHGGWAIGPRYLVPSLPFWALLAGGLFALPLRRVWIIPARASATLAVVYSIFVMLVATAVKPEVTIKAQQPIHGYLLPAFFEGRLAQNVVSTKMVSWKADAERAAWNLGERMGLEGLWTLVPLALYATLAGAWWVRCAGRVAPQSS